MDTQTRPQRTRRSPEAARAEILRAAESALAEMEYSALTVDVLMGYTGMTRSSFYHYFNGLDDIAVGLLDQMEQDIRESVDSWLKGEVDSGDYLRATESHLQRMFEVIQTHRQAHAAVAQAASGNPRVYRAWQQRVVDYFVELTTAFIQRQVALGRSSVADPERVARSLILMNNAVSNDNLTRAEPDTPKVLARVIAGIWNAVIFSDADLSAAHLFPTDDALPLR